MSKLAHFICLAAGYAVAGVISHLLGFGEWWDMILMTIGSGVAILLFHVPADRTK